MQQVIFRRRNPKGRWHETSPIQNREFVTEMADLVLAVLAFMLAGVVVHINYKEKRLTRLFYAALDLLSRCHRI